MAAFEPSTNLPLDVARIAKRLLSDKTCLRERFKDLLQSGRIIRTKNRTYQAKENILNEIVRENSIWNFASEMLSRENESINAYISKAVGCPLRSVASENAVKKLLEGKSYKIADAKSIRGIPFDFIAEKTSRLRTQVVLVRILEENGKEEDVVRFVEDVDHAKEFEPRIAEAYIFATGFSQDAIKLEKRTPTKSYKLFLQSLEEDQ